MSDEQHQGESLLGILDELNELISTARAMPMSASALVNRAEVLDLISSAREVLPRQIAQADKIREDAQDILERAHDEAQQLVSDQTIVIQAQKKAQEIIADAEAKAEQLASEADDYCDQKLAEFEIDLNKISSQVAAGRERLQQRSAGEDT
ncbi:MAG TPA: hypothetical protein VK054_12145 [Beutenbergiaceae bacterium]|nr:hypothetical protein [Beutenbergiaceae bacterium]